MKQAMLLLVLAAMCMAASSCSWLPGGRRGNDLETMRPADELPSREAARAAFVIARDLHREGLLDFAVVHYLQAREHDPSIRGVARNLAVIYDRQGLNSRAEAEYERALAEEPRSSTVLNDFGYFHYSRGRHAEAEDFFRRALRADRSNDRARINLGLALAQQGRYDEAFEAFRAVVTEAEAHSNLAMIQTQRGEYDLAEESFERALRRDPMLRPAATAFMWLEDFRAGRRDTPMPPPDGDGPAAY